MGAEEVEKNSGGKIKVKYYPAEQMGKEADIVTSMQMGSVESSILGPTIYQQAAPKYNIWSAYYLFDDSKQAMALQETEVGQECRDAVLKNKGIRIVGYGMRAVPGTSPPTNPLKNPRMSKGLKIRCPAAAHLRGLLEKDGGPSRPPIAFSEVYTSLKMGVVDAQENPLMLIESAHFDEVPEVCEPHRSSIFFLYLLSERGLV